MRESPAPMPRAAIAELEAQLQARWSAEAAAVYADALQAAGDPRGELIALDLQLGEQPHQPALVAARHAAVQRWLGDRSTEGHWPPYTHRYGLVDVTLAADAHSTIDDRAGAVLGSPAGRYLRHVAIFGDAGNVQRALARLTAEPRPWLRSLAIDQTDHGPVPRPLITALAAAAPRLRALELRGERVLTPPLPASVTRLALLGRRALTISDTPVTGITELDLALDALDVASLRNLANLVEPRVFPDLVTLDLARNEGHRPMAARNLDPLIFVHALGKRGGLDRLRSLRLPSLRDTGQHLPLRRLLDARPGLEVDVVRSYRHFDRGTRRLAHPRLRVAPPRPWPPADLMSELDALVILVPGRHAVLLLVRCVAALEATFDRMTPAARDGWTALWNEIDHMPTYPADHREPVHRLFQAAPLAAALAEIPRALDSRCAGAAALLREVPVETVELQRRSMAGGPATHGALGVLLARLRAEQARPAQDLVDVPDDVF
ncbi:MAG TPA: hypothetical protein VGC42_21355 [Kofleriaceae bacterium]